jgi:CrcB protein
MSDVISCLLVGTGGFIGAIARFALARFVATSFDTRFPLGTFIINVSGSFLLGILGTVVTHRMSVHADALRLALGVGFLGAYTTFSTFEFETHTLLDNGAWVAATVYMAASLFVGLMAVRAGILLTRNWAF